MVPDTGALDAVGPGNAPFAAAPAGLKPPAARPAGPGPSPAAPATGKPAKKKAGKPAKKTAGKPAKKKTAGKTQATARPATAQPGQAAPAPGRAGLAAARRSGRRKLRRVYLVAGGAAVAGVAAAAAFVLLPGSGGPAHVITTPHRVGSYVQAPALAATMNAAQLRNGIVSQSSGEASHVVAVVYQSNSGPGGQSSPDIILFIGGNLSGSSASSFISSFAGRVPGAFTTTTGSLGGSAACVPGVSGRPAECAWADNDTFGLVASTTLSGEALASEMRQLRPQVEHRAG